MRTSSTSCPMNSASNSHLSLRSCSSSVSTSWKVIINLSLGILLELLNHQLNKISQTCLIECVLLFEI